MACDLRMDDVPESWPWLLHRSKALSCHSQRHCPEHSPTQCNSTSVCCMLSLLTSQAEENFM